LRVSKDEAHDPASWFETALCASSPRAAVLADRPIGWLFQPANERLGLRLRGDDIEYVALRICPGRDAACNAASQNRDRRKLRIWNGPGSAERHEERRTASGAQTETMAQRFPGTFKLR
jgi:hypothetical protein